MDILLNNVDTARKPYSLDEEASSINYGNVKNKAESDQDDEDGDLSKSNGRKFYNPAGKNPKYGTAEKSKSSFASANDTSSYKAKRYSKNNNSNKKPATSAATSNHHYHHGAQGGDSATSSAIESVLPPSSNSVLCLREINVPLIQYKNYQNSSGTVFIILKTLFSQQKKLIFHSIRRNLICRVTKTRNPTM